MTKPTNQKEVIINLDIPANEMELLVLFLSQELGAIPDSSLSADVLTYTLLTVLSDEEIKAKIEPTIGSHVTNVTINNK